MPSGELQAAGDRARTRRATAWASSSGPAATSPAWPSKMACRRSDPAGRRPSVKVPDIVEIKERTDTMSLVTALYSGASGLDSNSTELSVVGDNIANANTIGFKASRAAFADAMAQNLIGGRRLWPARPGGGAADGAEDPVPGLAGEHRHLHRPRHRGARLFRGLAARPTARTGTYYTRAGQFTVDQDGYLVNLDGPARPGLHRRRHRGAGAPPPSAICRSATPAPRRGPRRTSPCEANLQADAVVPVDAVRPGLTPAATSNFASSTTVFDSLGRPTRWTSTSARTGRREPGVARPHRRREPHRRHRRHPDRDRQRRP